MRASTSVVRTSLMDGLSLFALTVRRRQDGLNNLAFVVLTRVLILPLIALKPRPILLSVSASDWRGLPSLEVVQS